MRRYRWVHRDGDLIVASEYANPGLAESLSGDAKLVCETRHFSVLSQGEHTVLLHGFPPDEIDNELAEYVAGELVRSGCVTLSDAFERCFAGVVLSSAFEPDEAWRLFYGNTLSRLESGDAVGEDAGPISSFAGIYARAESFVVGDSLLDAGTCFGFFPLLAKRHEPHLRVTALDLSAPILDLARGFGDGEESGPVEFVAGDACSLPFPDDSFDTVTLLHVLEHLSPEVGGRVVEEIARVARRRVVIAVPLEDEPDDAFGHVRSFSRESLVSMVSETGCQVRYEEFRGGWVVMDRD